MPSSPIDRSSKPAALGAAVAVGLLTLCRCTLPDVTLSSMTKGFASAGMGGSADVVAGSEGHEVGGSPAEQEDAERNAGAGGSDEVEAAGRGGVGGAAGSSVEVPTSGAGGAASQSDMQPMPPQNDPGDDEPPPVPADPCNTDNGGCHPLAGCTSDPDGGAVQCECPVGYEGSGIGSDGCRDIDQCATDNGGCDTSPRATCENFPGTDVACTCPDGSVGNGVGEEGCGDSNECVTDNGGCDTSPLARCMNRAGGEPPTCECPPGYRGDGVGRSGCVDIDECSTMTNGGCDTWPLASCSNTEGDRECSCPPGYQGPGIGGGGCYDIDECETDNGGCDTSPRATCINTEGGRECSCPQGTALSEQDDDVCARLFYDASFVWDYHNSVTWQRLLPDYYPGCTARYDEAGSPGDVCTFYEASQYCWNLVLEDNSNWRLPSLYELESLVYDSGFGEPKIDTVTFPDTPSRHFWSSEEYDSSNAWYVDFEYGDSDYEPSTRGHYIRCVTDWTSQ